MENVEKCNSKEEKTMHMKKNIRMRGITGLRHIECLDRWDGRRDAKHNQVHPYGEQYSTPRIIQKGRICDRYCNEIYLLAIEALRKLYVDISVYVEELHLLEQPVKTEKNDLHVRVSDISIEKGRHWDEENAKKIKKEERKKELITQLAQFREKCKIIDEETKHQLDRARAVLMLHVEAYWSGVLWGLGENGYALVPTLLDEEMSGKVEYEEHYQQVCDLLNRVFLKEEKEDEREYGERKANE